ncbi:low affinity immunoglobulin epsilon Fc receptor-like isoform X2 [Labeo rohita]|uniref:low affinity immunoglobulin epsilon Fc receptor-like isoform X2 n=1 Tax=Labeo rohita TaxID=84645 RepID=UPI0021E1F8F7|nr:low affinity immunoglobulin epsilon Fc receptor-like isoform X2 [Labeo rohita]
MRKLLLLVLTITVFSSPPVQDEKLPDEVVKVPVVEQEPTVELTEEQAGPRIQDEAIADSRMVEPDSVLLEPETTEEHRKPEETQVMMEEPVLEADYLPKETPETELEPELEITASQIERNNVSEHIVAEDLEIQMEPERGSRRANTGRWSCGGVILQGKCYQYFRINLDGFHAEYHCKSICHNGNLASVASSYILGELGNLMDQNGGRTHAWLGGRRVIGTNNFKWLDRTLWSYNGWNVGEPNNAGGMENCVETWYNLAFNDAPCTIPKPFICSCPL